SYVKLATARALLENGSLAIPGHGKLTAISPADGRTYSKFEVLHSLLFLPATAAGKLLVEAGLLPPERRGLADAAFAGLLGPLSATAAVVLFFLWARRIFRSETGALRAALVLGTATLLWPYAKRGWTEMPQTAFLLGSVLLLERARARGSGGQALAAGLLLGGAIALRVTGVVLLPVLALPLLFRWERPPLLRRALLYAAGILLAVLPLVLGANLVRFGSPFSLFAWRAGGFSANFAVGLAGLLASPGESLFLYSPVLLVALPLLPRLRFVDRGAFLVALLAPIALLFLYAPWWFHAYTWGPRFLLPAIPFLALPLAHPAAWRKPLRSILAALLVLSVLLQVLGVLLHVGDLPDLEKPLVRHGLLPPDRPLTREDTWFHPLRTRPAAHLLLAGECAEALLRGEKAPIEPDLWPFVLRDTLGVPLRWSAPIEAALLLLAAAGMIRLVGKAREESVTGLPPAPTPPASGEREAVDHPIVFDKNL
ncbi:MAG: glycosyltransferase family 39 protein, partial [Candidatus Eisenbacteria bacterium]